VSSAGPPGADVGGAGLGRAVLDDLGAVVVEDEQLVVGLDEQDGLGGHQAGDVEPGSADLDDAVAGDSGDADPVPADWSLLVAGPGWLGLPRRLPGLQWGDP
jgi:hypothetical protein